MIPSGWESCELGDRALFLSGGTPSKAAPANWGGDFPWVSAKDLKSHYIRKAELGLTDIGQRLAHIAPEHSVLILVRGMTLLKDVPIGLTTRSVAFNQDIKALIPDDRVDATYLSYILVERKSTLLSLVNTANHGTGRLDTELLKGLAILVPPLWEQRRIVDVLSTWDRAIETVEALIGNARLQKQALARALLTGKRRLPGFSGQWRWSDFATLFNLRIGGTPSRQDSSLWDSDKTTENRWVAIADLSGKFLGHTREHISDRGVRKSNVKLLPAGTVIMSFKLSIGKKAILKYPSYTNEAICGIIPKNSLIISNLFLYHSLDNIALEENVDQAVKGKTLNKAKIAELKFAYPERDEQRAIATVLEAADDWVANRENYLAALRSEKAALMQQLLTGRRRVKLDPAAA